MIERLMEQNQINADSNSVQNFNVAKFGQDMQDAFLMNQNSGFPLHRESSLMKHAPFFLPQQQPILQQQQPIAQVQQLVGQLQEQQQLPIGNLFRNHFEKVLEHPFSLKLQPQNRFNAEPNQSQRDIYIEKLERMKSRKAD